MIIEIRNVDIETAKGKNGKPYEKATVTYRDDKGKTNNKTVMSFAGDVFTTIKNAKTGDVLEVKSEKNANGFWEWVSATRSERGLEQNSSPSPRATGTAATRSTYETPEERAKKQIYIVRQSSISSAIATLSVGAKTPPNADAVIALAREYENYVFGQEQEATSALKPIDDDFGNDDIPF